jgi:hypothetical protein
MSGSHSSFISVEEETIIKNKELLIYDTFGENRQSKQNQSL